MNQQPREPAYPSQAAGEVEVHSVWLTIQGEGPFAGRPAVFVRLAGCNLQCKGCDTDYTSRRELLTPRQIVAAQVVPIAKGVTSLVVLTGGEPLRQDIGPLCRLLLEGGWSVQLETNGTFYRKTVPYDAEQFTTVVSPKTPRIHQMYYKPPRWWKCAHWKYVVQAGHVDDDGLPTQVLDTSFPMNCGKEGCQRRPIAKPPHWLPRDQIYIQPYDESWRGGAFDASRNAAHMEQAVNVCMEHGYRLSLQTHKIAGLP